MREAIPQRAQKLARANVIENLDWPPFFFNKDSHVSHCSETTGTCCTETPVAVNSLRR